jgi:hypothetical protein
MSKPDTDTGVSETTHQMRRTLPAADRMRGSGCWVGSERGRAGLGGVAAKPAVLPGVVTHDERAVLCPRRRSSTRPAVVTSTADGRDHLVSAAAASVGPAAGHGKCVALCGRLVLAASLTVPPGPTCVDCETALHRVTVDADTSCRRGGLIARLRRRGRSRTGWRARSAGRHRAVQP